MRTRRMTIACLGTGLTLIVAGLTPMFLRVPVSLAQDDGRGTEEPAAYVDDEAPVDDEAVIDDEAPAEEEAAVEDETPVETVEADDDVTAEPVETEEPAVPLADPSPEATFVDLQSLTIDQPPANAATVQPTGDNGYCAVCHSQPWRAVTLEDGFVLNLFVDPETITNSVHGEGSEASELGCVDCHDAGTFPHDGPTPHDSRSYTLSAVEMCGKCHTEEARDLESGLHEQAIARGNKDAAVCTDCHGAHDIQSSANRSQLVAGVCGDCHTSTLTEWRDSPHVDIGPLGCATCHSPHSQELRVGDSNELCINCHNQPENIWVHDTHQDTGGDIEVACADCHMFTDPEVHTTLVSLKPTGHTMMLDTRPCNSCHNELEESGQWQALADEQQAVLVGERNELESTVAELQAELSTRPEVAEPEAPAGISYVQLIQGLILGLGFGITAAVIMLPRFRRGKEPNDSE